MNNSDGPLPNAILDEIGLEGLDGITLEGLWKRLSIRRKLALPLHENFREKVWQFIVKQKCFQFYKLPADRDELKIFDRSEHVDPEVGMPYTSEICPFTFYKFNPIKIGGLWGSCQDFNERTEIDRKDLLTLTCERVEEHLGRKFIIVGSQKLRESCILPRNFVVNDEFGLIRYCLMERIGRSRYNGELTLGKHSLLDVCSDSSVLFYNRKYLTRLKLITRQVFAEKKNEINVMGLLLHLPRFYVGFKSKQMIVTEQIVEILKKSPNRVIESSVLLSNFDEHLRTFIKKLQKTQIFQKLIHVDPRILYREIFPDANEKEWKAKNGTEKFIKVFRLRDINTNVNDLWPHDPELEEDDGDGSLDVANQQIEVPLTRQLYNLINDAKTEGVIHSEIGKYFGLNKLASRAVIKRLVKSKTIVSRYTQIGRQKTRKFFTLHYANETDKPIENDTSKTTSSNHSNLINESTTSIDVKTNLNEKSKDQEGKLTLINSNDTATTTAVTTTTTTTTTPPKPTPTTTINTNESETEIILTDEFLECILMRSVKDLATQLLANKELIEESMSVETTVNCVKCTPFCSANKKQRIYDYDRITPRTLQRINIILNMVLKYILIDGIAMIFTGIATEEKLHGYTDKMCRKSLQYLLTHLGLTDQLRIWDVTFKLKNKLKNLVFISRIDLDEENAILQLNVEQAKLKFLLAIDSERSRLDIIHKQQNILTKNENNGRTGGEGCLSTSSSSSSPSQNDKFNKKMTISKRKYENSLLESNLKSIYSRRNLGNAVPKFLRMRTFHEFLFYLVYDYSKDKNIIINKNDAITEWSKFLPIIDFDEIKEQLPTIYSLEINWKMFVAPLINPNIKHDGWCLLYDIMLRIPLSLYIRICNLPESLHGLNEYVQHPIKRHYPLSYLSTELKFILFYRRRYIYVIDEIIKKLACMGLLRIGQQLTREKEQSLIYINRNASIMDTTSSDPGYAYISQDKEYPIISFHFETLYDVCIYWDQLSQICTHTKLGKRTTMPETIVGRYLQSKSEMVEYLKPQTMNGAIELDTGEIPGDRLGAGGLDNLFFSHLTRNWVFNFTSSKSKLLRQNIEKKFSKSVIPIRISRLMKRQRKNKGNSQFTTADTRKPKSSSTSTNRKSIYTSHERHTTPKNTKLTRRPVYDDVDESALKLMKKLRVDWDEKEDNFILLCKVALMYFSTNTHKQFINCSTLRDLLHWYCKSLSKTSRACQRRITFRMKNPTIASGVHMCLEEVKRNKEVLNRYSLTFIDDLKAHYDNRTDYLNALNIHFIDLVLLLTKIFVSFSVGTFESKIIVLPDSLKFFYKDYTVLNSSEHYKHQKLLFHQPKTLNSIQESSISILIHSSLCCCQDKTSYGIQLYNVYKNYSDEVLGNAMYKLRNDQLISANKTITGTIGRPTKYLPLTTAPYHLSVTYLTQMTSVRIAYSIFSRCFVELTKALCQQTTNFMDLTGWNTGNIYYISELMILNLINLKIIVPEEVLTIDDQETIDVTVAEGDKKNIQRCSKSQQTQQEDIHNEKLLRLNNNLNHFFCLINIMPTRTNNSTNEINKLPSINSIVTMIDMNELKLDVNNYCPFNCILKNKINKWNILHDVKRIISVNRDILLNIKVDHLDETIETDQIVLPDSSSSVILNESNLMNIFKQLISTRIQNQIDINDAYEVALEILESINDETIQINEQTPIDVIEDFISENFTIDIADDDNVNGTQTVDIVDDDEDGGGGVGRGADGKGGGSGADNIDDVQLFEDKVQRNHDLIKINPCRMLLNFQINRESNDEDELTTVDDIEIDKIFVPLNLEMKNELLLEIKKNALWSHIHGTDNDFSDSMLKQNFSNFEHLVGLQVLNCVVENKELGVTAVELSKQFQDRSLLTKIITILINLNIIMKTGVVDYTYVYWMYIEPWIIKVPQIKRLDKEAIEPINAKVYAIHQNDKETQNSTVVDNNRTLADGSSNANIFSDIAASSSIITDLTYGDAMHSDKQTSSKRRLSMSDIDEYKVIKKIKVDPDVVTENEMNDVEFDQTNEQNLIPGTEDRIRKSNRLISSALLESSKNTAAEKIIDRNILSLRPSPWIRINGTLNRRVLDKWMGTILGYCLTYPCVKLKRLCTNFNFLQPVFVRQLLEYLEKLKCIQLFVQETQSSTLFRRSKILAIDPATDFDSIEDIIVDVKCDAVTKFAFFLGKRKYEKDFI